MDLCWIARRAEAVVLLPGWGISKGALTETALALALGLKFYLYDKNFSDKLLPIHPSPGGESNLKLRLDGKLF